MKFPEIRLRIFKICSTQIWLKNHPRTVKLYFSRKLVKLVKLVLCDYWSDSKVFWCSGKLAKQHLSLSEWTWKFPHMSRYTICCKKIICSIFETLRKIQIFQKTQFFFKSNGHFHLWFLLADVSGSPPTVRSILLDARLMVAEHKSAKFRNVEISKMEQILIFGTNSPFSAQPYAL